MAQDDAGITGLLARLRGGDAAAADALFERVYAELRRLAGAHLRKERQGHTLQPTALVHEAYLKLIGGDNWDWRDRRHFFNVSAQIMRNILVDHARKHKAEKRGGEGRKLSLDEAVEYYGQRDLDLVDLDQALTELAALDPDQSRIVELKFFAGLRIDELAGLLGVSEATVNRQWHKAKMWLRSRMQRDS
jgi:RNA polymerase sigma-70 factor (ECF subfamily)